MTGREAALPLLFQVFDILEVGASQAQTLAPEVAPTGLAQFDGARSGPQLLFPPDGASVLVDGYGPKSRGLVLEAQGDNVRWYIDGAPVRSDSVETVWRPDYPRFYDIAAVDDRGRRSLARVRVR